jgi:hypothetical protein
VAKTAVPLITEGWPKLLLLFSGVAKTPMALCNYSRAVKTDVALITAERKSCCSTNYSRVLKTAEHFNTVAKNQWR